MGKPKKTVCFCLDVTEDDVLKSIKEGYDHVETLKRFTGACMGPCQGKYCVLNLVSILAKELGKNPGEVHVPTVRPPVKPIFLGALAASEK